MGDTILLFESRDLCYESNRHFMRCLEDAFENMGYPVEICDLSLQMEEKLEQILERQEKYSAAFDFNSFLPRLELEDGTPYLAAFQVPFFNYLVDHPLYHHVGLKRSFPRYSVICIDMYHREYVKEYYPHIEHVYYLPLGAMQAGIERGPGQKRFELLFLGTYELEKALYQQLEEYPADQRKEISVLIEMMNADHELTQEAALKKYLEEKNQILSREQFAKRLNGDYLADKYLRNLRRKEAVLAAAKGGIPFTVMGHGWENLTELEQGNTVIRPGVGFAVSLQMLADAKMLLNSTPGFHGGLHDRVYSAMLNHTLVFTEGNSFSKQKLTDGEDAVFYDSSRPDTLTEKLVFMYENLKNIEIITECAYQKALSQETWENRAGQMIEMIREAANQC